MSDAYLMNDREKGQKAFMEGLIANAIRAFNRETGLVVEAIDFDAKIFQDDPETLVTLGEVRSLVRRP